MERLRALGVEAARADTARVHRMYGGTRRRPWRVETGELSLVLLEGALAEAVRGETVSAPGEPAVYAKLDPRDGTAVKARWAAVMATRAGEAACWAEALLAIGTDGAGLVGEHPIEAAIAPADGTPWISPGFDAEARD